MQIFLSDKRITRKGEEKERPWRKDKKLSRLLADSYRRLGDTAKPFTVGKCAAWLDFKEFSDETKKLHSAEFCRARLCPMCATRRSKKSFGQVSKIMDHLEESQEYRYIFLTLTVRNMVGDDLSKAIDELMEMWHKLTRTKEFKKLSKGFFRSLEVELEEKRKGYFHPHLHAIIAVNKSYFSRRGSPYLSQKAWRNLWIKCGKLDYDPWVHVQTVKPDKEKTVKGEKSYSGAVSEVAKYMTKGSQFIADPFEVARSSGIKTEGQAYEQLKLMCEEFTDSMVATLDYALKGRRLISFGGLMRDAHKILNLDDPADGDLINTDNAEEIREDLDYIIRTYRWNVEFMNYVLDEAPNEGRAVE